MAEAQLDAPVHVDEPHAPETEAPAPHAPQVATEVAVGKDEGIKEKKKRGPKVKKVKTPAHPPYFQMIKEAITSLNEKAGSSPYAIAKC